MKRKREAILAAARRQFLAHGYGGTSMEAIADAAGVSIMTLYRHAETKDELFDKWAQLTLVEYDCGTSVIYVPGSLDGDQEYIFDATGKLIGENVSSDHGPPCSAGADVGESCVVSSCAQSIWNCSKRPLQRPIASVSSGIRLTKYISPR